MKFVYLIIGFVSVALGSIGVILPILPTTPFLLLALVCFSKSSKRIEKWFTSTTLYKNHLDSFIKYRQMTLKTKVCLLTFASTMLVFAFCIMNNFYGKLMIICLIIFKYYYFIFKIKTIEKGSMISD